MKQLESNNIDYTFYDFAFGTKEWYDTGPVDITRNENEQECEKTYRECLQKGCLTLADGMLSICGRVMVLTQLYSFLGHDNKIDIGKCALADIETIRKEIYHYLENKNFKEACRYCLGTQSRVEAGVQLPKDVILQYKDIRNGKRSLD